MHKGISKLKTNTIGLIKSTLLLKPIVTKSGTLYKLKYAFSLILLYFIIYFIPSLFIIKRNLKNILLNCSLFFIYLTLFLVVALIYKKIQKGPYHYKKYLTISIVSQIFLPFVSFIFLFNYFVCFFVLICNVIISCFFTSINFTYLSFWEGRDAVWAYCVILFNNLIINLTVLVVIKIFKFRK
ncbi:hypothetical protein TUBRATIS_27840 [Tubulinosema ratisbonensis]|uniref:Uncharacterized protein n=1 Tax=Tubulinosema ratisbonensis TaxID=291195 RepID=A0A437AI81_9MICR|nr:hypothetical protein TUBRATIS_27840 [Tubulinosema ratisbonensis]